VVEYRKNWEKPIGQLSHIRIRTLPQPQSIHQNSKCNLLLRDEIGNTPQ
jgi:hypothetical protein